VAKDEEHDILFEPWAKSFVEQVASQTTEDVVKEWVEQWPDAPAYMGESVFHKDKACAARYMGFQMLRSKLDPSWKPCSRCAKTKRYEEVLVLGGTFHENLDCQWKFTRCESTLRVASRTMKPCSKCVIRCKKEKLYFLEE